MVWVSRECPRLGGGFPEGESQTLPPVSQLGDFFWDAPWRLFEASFRPRCGEAEDPRPPSVCWEIWAGFGKRGSLG